MKKKQKKIRKKGTKIAQKKSNELASFFFPKKSLELQKEASEKAWEQRIKTVTKQELEIILFFFDPGVYFKRRDYIRMFFLGNLDKLS